MPGMSECSISEGAAEIGPQVSQTESASRGKWLIIKIEKTQNRKATCTCQGLPDIQLTRCDDILASHITSINPLRSR